MDVSGWIIVCGFVYIVGAERAAITHCSTQKYPSTDPTGTASTTGTGTKNILVQDETYMFHCCGVVKVWNYVAAGTDLTFQIWRQTAADAFTVISQSDSSGHTSGATVAEEKRVSFQEGDMIGWRGGSGGGIQYSTSGTAIQLNRYSTSVGALSVGGTFNWNSASVDAAIFRYGVQAETTASTIPYFRTLPTTLSYADTDTLIGGITLLTVTFHDLDPDDVSGLTATMAPEWTDYFAMDPTTFVVTSARKLEPGTYHPIFRVEETHCGQTASAILTVTVTDSVPSITNLPGSASIHEDTLDEQLLYTVTTSDPTNQAILCTASSWTPGTATPFVVKMISTTAGSSTAGIYLMEWPQLDYGTNSYYDLTISCEDTAGNAVTGKFWVNIIENQRPVFVNLGNMVEIDSTTTIIGTTIFTVSTSDAEGDQITYTHTCSPLSTADGNCPFTVYDNGEVVLTENQHLWNTATYTLTITATDLRAPVSAARDLVIYIINQNNDPVLTNVNVVTQPVAENTALGTSIYQVSATDADATDTVTFYMTFVQDEASKLFEMSSTGLVSTHSTFNIDFDLLSTQSFGMVIYAHDGKEYVKDTLTLTVTNVNEAVTFTQPAFSTTTAEGSAIGTALPTAYIDASDPDTTSASDTMTFTMDCGSYDSYFTLNSGTKLVSMAQVYDLDAGSLPQEVTCSLVVVDSGSINDTATLYIVIEYANDNTPVFDPSTYTISVRSDTPLRENILTVTASDADAGDHGVLTYTLTQTSLGGTYFVVQDGGIYANVLLTALATAGTKTITVTATDGGGLNAVATVTITFIDATVVPTVSSVRHYLFIEDPRNVAWFTLSILTIAVCLAVIIFIIIAYCKGRQTPFFSCFTVQRPKRRRELDAKRRPKPFGRQEPPLYRHVHARELLRPAPPIATPEPVTETDKYSNRRNSADSNVYGRVTVSQVNLDDHAVESWMDRNDSPPLSKPPARTVTTARASDREYFDPSRRGKSSSVASTEALIPPSPSISILLEDDSRRRGGQSLTTSTLRVTESPHQWNNMTINTGYTNTNYSSHFDDEGSDHDDFRSERLSVAK